MDVLIRSKTDIDRRFARSSEQLCSRVLVEHPFTECAEFFPLEAAVLVGRLDIQQTWSQRDLKTYNELFVPQGRREASVECDPEVFSIVTLVHHDVFQKCSLVTKNLGQSSTSSE